MATTFISKISVDLWAQSFTLEWKGDQAATQPVGPFHCTPGKGLPGLNCDNVQTSRTSNTNCTPKGTWTVLGHQRAFGAFPEAEWVTQFQSLERGIAFHYYPRTPEAPASSGCIRIRDKNIAKLIHNKTLTHKTIVSVQGELRPQMVVLRRGDRDENVRKMQRRLSESGYRLSVDGDFGPGTEAVVKQFQRDKGLAGIDGIFGPATYTALFTNTRVLVHA